MNGSGITLASPNWKLAGNWYNVNPDEQSIRPVILIYPKKACAVSSHDSTHATLDRGGAITAPRAIDWAIVSVPEDRVNLVSLSREKTHEQTFATLVSLS